MNKAISAGIFLWLLFVPFVLPAQQAQSDPLQARREKNVTQPIDAAQGKADKDLAQAKKEAALQEAEILYEQGTLRKKVAEMEQKKAQAEKRLELLNTQYTDNDKEIARLQKRIEDEEGAMNEVSGSVRGIAQDTSTALRQSIVSGQHPGRDKELEPLLSELEFPSLENIKSMADVMFGEIRKNGDIFSKEMLFIDDSGRKTKGTVIRIGAFNALYEKDGDVGYLKYSPVKQSYHELTVSPPSSMINEAEEFAVNESPGCYIDLSGGSAFRQLTDMPSWYEQLKSGGFLMYPLLIVGFVAVILMIERLYVLSREGKDAEQLSGRISSMLQQKSWDEAMRQCSRKKGSLSHVIQAGINHRHERVEVLESVMEEAIQSAMPRLDRNMSALQILGMVSPLLGLLGTVTGMIATFQMITLYGTGDPKIMSGGISEALITTQYGLIVAIPIILVHGYLQGRIDRIIGLLEEKAIMLVNTVKKTDQHS